MSYLELVLAAAKLVVPPEGGGGGDASAMASSSFPRSTQRLSCKPEESKRPYKQ